jgi:hypothetical protein
MTKLRRVLPATVALLLALVLTVSCSAQADFKVTDLNTNSKSATLVESVTKTAIPTTSPSVSLPISDYVELTPFNPTERLQSIPEWSSATEGDVHASASFSLTNGQNIVITLKSDCPVVWDVWPEPGQPGKAQICAMFAMMTSCTEYKGERFWETMKWGAKELGLQVKEVSGSNVDNSIRVTLSPSETGIYKLTLLNQDALNSHYCKYDISLQASASVPVPLPSTAPQAPVLVAPTNGATISTLTPTLVWTTSAGAASYGASIKDIVASYGSLNTQYTVASGLLRWNTLYYWKAIAANSSGSYSEWSAEWTFRTASGPTSAVSSPPSAPAPAPGKPVVELPVDSPTSAVHVIATAPYLSFQTPKLKPKGIITTVQPTSKPEGLPSQNPSWDPQELRNKISELAQDYAEKHPYSSNNDCKGMSVSLWRILKSNNIQALIANGNLEKWGETRFGGNHMWLIVMDREATPIPVEATDGAVMDSTLAYYKEACIRTFNDGLSSGDWSSFYKWRDIYDKEFQETQQYLEARLFSEPFGVFLGFLFLLIP